MKGGSPSTVSSEGPWRRSWRTSTEASSGRLREKGRRVHHRGGSAVEGGEVEGLESVAPSSASRGCCWRTSSMTFDGRAPSSYPFSRCVLLWPCRNGLLLYLLP